MKKISYFVSYAFYSEKQSGFGSIHIKLTYKIKSYDDIIGIKKYLDLEVKDAYGEKCECAVINYIKI